MTSNSQNPTTTPLTSTTSTKSTRDTSEIFKEFDGFIQNNGKPYEVILREIFKEFDGFIQNNGKPYEVILRNKKANQIRKPFQDRLSVPNLSEDPTILAQQKQNNGTSVESTTKFGRAPDTGELQTINEGLITPVIRRKQFAAALSGPSPENYTNPEYFERRNGKIAIDFEMKNVEKEQQRLAFFGFN
uniref:Uncharacterized protein n=1 Tax=Panagrolaimus sp. PS1159 TaxID=55785 RepID=A0AC35FX15_9BILA